MSTGSIVVRRSLGRRLKGLREQAGKTSADVVEAAIASKAKLARIEAGQVPVKVPDVRTMCWLYGADEATTEQLVDLALTTSEKGWWEPFGSVMPSWFTTYVELEASADRLRAYASDLVPGLLQTPAYHRAVFDADPLQSPEDAERTVQLRIERQRAAFERTAPLHVTAVLSEGVLARQIGGADVMVEQRQRLRELARRDHITICVLPWSAGAHAALKGAFNILSFDAPGDDDDTDAVYLEARAGGQHIWDPSVVRVYADDFDRIQAQSVPLEEYLQ